MSTTAALYARISSDPRETALGVARQVKDCTKLAERKGWTITGTYVDNDVSASSGKPRPQYEAMMAALAAGKHDALVVWDVDRLTRTPRELEDIIDLAEKRGVQLASVGGEIDLSTPQGQLTARIKGDVAKHESQQLGRRVKAKMAERRAAGAAHGPVRYGWRREQVFDDSGRKLSSHDVLHPEHAEVVRRCVQELLAGNSLRAITARLNADGVAGARGGVWTTTTLRAVLLRESNAGLLVHAGQVVGTGDWEPIIDEDTHGRVVAILSDPSRRTSPQSSAIKYLLSGIAKCGVCGGPMRVLTAGKDRRKSPTYVCHRASHVRRAMHPLDELVTGMVVGLLASPKAAGVLTRDDDDTVSQAREKASALRAKLDLAADQWAADIIDGRQLARITAKLRPELEVWEATARAGSTSPDLLDLATPDIAERWALAEDDPKGIPLARKRAVIDLLLDITVNRAAVHGGHNVFDPFSVTITEKD